MLKRSLAAGLLACAALTSPALAQDKAQGDSIKYIQTIEKEQFRSSNLVGQTVYNQQDENIGEISDLILDQGGRVAGVIIGVGGFLGMGQSDVAVPMNALKFVRDDQAMASNDTASPSGRAAADAQPRKEPGSAEAPSGTSTTAALPNQNVPDPGNAQQNAAEGAGQAKQDPAQTGTGTAPTANANNAAPNAAPDRAENNAAGGTGMASGEENSLEGMKIVLNTNRADLTDAPKLGEDANEQNQTGSGTGTGSGANK